MTFICAVAGDDREHVLDRTHTNVRCGSILKGTSPTTNIYPLRNLTQSALLTVETEKLLRGIRLHLM